MSIQSLSNQIASVDREIHSLENQIHTIETNITAKRNDANSIFEKITRERILRKTAAFLASDRAGAMTEQSLPVVWGSR
jgi:hypothetical protein